MPIPSAKASGDPKFEETRLITASKVAQPSAAVLSTAVVVDKSHGKPSNPRKVSSSVTEPSADVGGVCPPVENQTSLTLGDGNPSGTANTRVYAASWSALSHGERPGKTSANAVRIVFDGASSRCSPSQIAPPVAGTQFHVSLPSAEARVASKTGGPSTMAPTSTINEPPATPSAITSGDPWHPVPPHSSVRGIGEPYAGEWPHFAEGWRLQKEFAIVQQTRGQTKGSKRYECRVCKKSCIGSASWQMHINSRKHKTNENQRHLNETVNRDSSLWHRFIASTERSKIQGNKE